MNYKKVLLGATCLACSALLISACGGGNDGSSFLRVVHLSADAPPVDVFIDNQLIAEGVTFGSQVDYLEIKPGTHIIKAELAGTDTTAVEAAIEFGDQQAQTIAAINRAASAAAVALIDDRSRPPEGSVRLRIFHAATTVPSVDVYAAPEGVSLGQASPLATNVQYSKSSPYTVVPQGAYHAWITLAGTKQVLLDIGKIAFTTRSSLTVIARDGVGGIGAPVIDLLDDTDTNLSDAAPTSAPTTAPTTGTQATNTPGSLPTSGPQETAAPAAPTATVAAGATTAPQPTSGPQPTTAPAPTSAPQPTSAPAPTKAPQPTQAPKPTAAPTSPPASGGLTCETCISQCLIIGGKQVNDVICRQICTAGYNDGKYVIPAGTCK